MSLRFLQQFTTVPLINNFIQIHKNLANSETPQKYKSHALHHCALNLVYVKAISLQAI